MRKNTSGFVHIILILIIVVLVGAVLFLGKDKLNKFIQVGSPVPSAISDPTIDWKSYTSKDGTLAFKVPADIVVKEENQIISITKSGVLPDGLMISYSSDGTEPVGYSGTAAGDRVLAGSINFFGQQITKTNLVYNGYVTEVFYGPSIKIGKSQFIITQNWGIDSKNGIPTETQNLFDQILSTFKFNDQTATPIVTAKPITYDHAGWQTYTDTNAGFSIMYPPLFKLGMQKQGESAAFFNCGGGNCSQGFVVNVYSDYAGGSRRDWLSNKIDLSTYSLSYEDFMVDGVNALIVKASDPGSSGSVFVVIPKGNKVFLYSAPSNQGNNDDVKQIVSSFKFQ